MVQKVLKVGTSAAVTLPKKSLEEFGIRIGDSIRVERDLKRKRYYIEPIHNNISTEVVDWTDTFIDQYRPALEALSKK